MSDIEFRAFLDLLTCSDPWPVPTKENDNSQSVLTGLAHHEAIKRGYDNWITAYHRHEGEPITTAIEPKHHH